MSDKKSLKIFHCADLHLDSPFSGLDAKSSNAAKELLRGTFTSMMLYAKTNNFDIVLISGDLFDAGYASNKTVSIMMEEFAKAPNIKFVISPGNHDPYTEGSIYATKKFPDNVHIFDDDSIVQHVSFDDLGTDVYGWAFKSNSIDESLINGEFVWDKERINLLCAHCDVLNPISKYCPVSESDIAAFGCDYNALGHVHKRTEPKRVGNSVWAYSGCPSGRGFDETGIGGAYIVEIDRESRKVDCTFRAFSHYHYEDESVLVSGAKSFDDVYCAVKNMIAQKKYDASTILRVTLEGATASFDINTDELEKRVEGLFRIIVQNNTLPVYDSAYLENDMTLMGELYRTLLPQMQNGSLRERQIAAMALRYGLTVLSGADITED